MVIFPLAPDQTIAQMWSNGARAVRRQHICVARNMLSPVRNLRPNARDAQIDRGSRGKIWRGMGWPM